MHKDEDGNLVVSRETLEISKDILSAVGLVFVTTRVIYFILSPGR